MSFSINYLKMYPESVEAKQIVAFEEKRLKKSIYLSGLAAAVSLVVAIVALALIPVIGQVLFGAFLGISLGSAACCYCSYKKRSELMEKIPGTGETNISKIFNSASRVIV